MLEMQNKRQFKVPSWWEKKAGNDRKRKKTAEKFFLLR
jgi:hypothetical protein